MLDHVLATLVQTPTAAHPPARALGVLDLVGQASLPVKAVLLVLVTMSVVCWFVVGAKLVRFVQVSASTKKFLDAFWAGGDGQSWTQERLEGLYASARSYEQSPTAQVFRAGYVELARVLGSAGEAGITADDLENVERAVRRARNLEMTALEALLPLLATTGSVGPFIGLFGTVVGIMFSFQEIAANGSASLDVVAPGISEALFATAVGLVAAIPAVMAYNGFIRRLQVVESDLEAFGYDFLNIVKRHYLRA